MATPRKDPRFTMDPELESLLPRCPVEVAELETRLLAEGCRDALVVWKGHGVLIDGHSRSSSWRFWAGPTRSTSLDLPDLQPSRTGCGTSYSRRNYSLEAKSYAGADSSWLSKASTAATVAAGISV